MIKLASFNKYFMASLLLATSIYTDLVLCQIVNIESQTQGEIAEGLSGEIELSSDSKSGNTEVNIVAADLNIFFRHRNHLGIFLFERDFGEQQGVRFSDSTFVHGRYRYQLSNNWWWEVFSQADRNDFKRRKLRTIVGSGPRWRIIGNGNFNLTIGSAPMWEKEEYTEQDGKNPERELIRLSNSIFAGYRLNESVIADLTLYWQPDPKDVKNFRALLESSLRFRLLDHLSYRISLKQVRDSRPPEGVKESDAQLTQSLIFDF